MNILNLTSVDYILHRTNIHLISLHTTLPVKTFPIFNQTCAAFFQVSTEVYRGNRDGSTSGDFGLHPVWARLPASAIAMSYFTAASYFLYMDTDAILTSPNYTPTSMYKTLAYDGYGENATFQTIEPSLIANKPFTGWLCSQCMGHGLGHGCFNSGALLWWRSEGASLVLKAWWESQHQNKTQNFHHEKHGYLHGWSKKNNEPDYADKMSEQNRLMYVFHTNPDVQKVMWPVPRQISRDKSSSCPKADGEEHTPCLQKDFKPHVTWNSSGPSCFIDHHADRKHLVHNVSEIILNMHPH